MALVSFSAFGQNQQLAQNYFDKGEFEKAIISYKELLEARPENGHFFLRLIECYQQLQRYDVAKTAIEERLAKYKEPNMLVELGYNYHLQKDENKARKYYEEAIEKIRTNPNTVYSVAGAFERRVLIDYALEAYKLGVQLEPKFNFNYQMAVLYGQKGDSAMMINTFLDEAYANPNSLVMIQNQLSRFLNEDSEETFVSNLRKALLLRAQKNQDIFWNQFLSWFYVQQKDYAKAFVQEKAVYKRNPESFSNIVNLAQMAMEEDEHETAKNILTFVLENTSDPELQIQSHFYLMEMRIESAKDNDYAAITSDIEKLLTEFGTSPYTLPLQTLQAHFTAFNLKNPEKAKTILKNALTLPLNKYQTAEVKMELADVLLFEEKFNQALLYYSQIEEDLKNDAVGHEASLKAARTSYFKEDFDWAQKQFKELKSAASQLIANDALEYFLLLSDNTSADSTQTALKKFARADYLLYQNRANDALSKFQEILKDHKGEEIEAVTLLRIGKIFESKTDYPQALANYQLIIDNHGDGIYIDEALFFSAEIFNRYLNDAEKAKPLYEKIIFEHQDSIHFVEARKKYRQLRGDTNI